jgi:hypothetical protein
MPRPDSRIALLLLAWWWMQAVHELGHVLAAVGLDRHVSGVDWLPWGLSFTQIESLPAPAPVVWAGLLCGAALPMFIWGLVRWRWPGQAHWWRFFAGFCLSANGAYALGGSLSPMGDVGDLLALGVPAWQPGVLGTLLLIGGLALWHGQGPRFASVTPAQSRRLWLLAAATAGLMVLLHPVIAPR